jgi:hypothetical protein
LAVSLYYNDKNIMKIVCKQFTCLRSANAICNVPSLNPGTGSDAAKSVNTVTTI